MPACQADNAPFTLVIQIQAREMLHKRPPYKENGEIGATRSPPIQTEAFVISLNCRKRQPSSDFSLSFRLRPFSIVSARFPLSANGLQFEDGSFLPYKTYAMAGVLFAAPPALSDFMAACAARRALRMRGTMKTVKNSPAIGQGRDCTRPPTVALEIRQPPPAD